MRHSGISRSSSRSHRSGIPFPVCAFILFSSLPSVLLSIQERKGNSTKVLSRSKEKHYLLFCIPAMLKCAESTKFLALKPEPGGPRDKHGFLLASTLLTRLSELLPPLPVHLREFRGKTAWAALNQPLLHPPALSIGSSAKFGAVVCSHSHFMCT